MILSRIFRKTLYQNRKHIIRRHLANENHPVAKTWNVLSKEIPGLIGNSTDEFVYPEHADIVIIGGGFIGVSAAYWLQSRATHGLKVVVIEKDITYAGVQKNQTLGILSQHFSLPENIYLSQYSAEFLRNSKELLENTFDLQYIPTGSLILASEKYADKLEHNVTILREHGVSNRILSTKEINETYPWINTNDIKLGCLSSESEGTFNPWILLKGLIQKAKDLGVIFINSEVTGFELEKQRDVLMEGIEAGSFERINKVVYKTPTNDEYSIKFAGCILAAGDKSSEIAKLAKIGNGGGMLQIPLPVEKRQYDVYTVDGIAAETGLKTPIVMDTSGLWLKRTGLESNLIFGQVPYLSTTDTINDYFTEIVKPSLLHRIPSSTNREIQTISTDMQDYNTFDDTGILGPHPYHNNLYIATGFGKLGCQHAPGIGRAIAELIIDSQYTTIDLTRFGFDRILTGRPVIESNIY